MIEKALCWVQSLCLLVVVAGCGGSSLQDEMRQRALAMAEAKRAERATEEAAEANQEAAGPVDDESEEQPTSGSSSSKPPATANAHIKHPTPSAPPAQLNAQVTAGAPKIQTSLKPIGQRRPSDAASAEERRAKVLANLKRIGRVCKSMNSGTFVQFADVVDNRRRPILSWRVHMLQELGHSELYSLFKLNEPWDSPHNIQLLPYIPEEFASPERFDSETNIQVIKGKQFAMGRRWRREDIYPSIAIVEVNNDYSVPWTQPADYGVDESTISDGIGGLHADGTLSLLLDGTAVNIPSDLDLGKLYLAARVEKNKDLAALRIVAAKRSASPRPSQAAPLAASQNSGGSVVANAAPVPGPSPAANLDVPPIPGISPLGDLGGIPSLGAPPAKAAEPPAESIAGASDAGENPVGTTPVPSESKLQVANEKLRDLFREQLAQATSRRLRVAFGGRMLDQAGAIGADPTGLYALLVAVRNVATAGSDFPLAQDANAILKKTFKVDPYDVDVATLRKFAPAAIQANDRSINVNGFGGVAVRVIGQAIERDDYLSATFCGNYLVKMVRLGDSSIPPESAAQIGHHLTVAHNQFKRTVPAINAMADDPNNAKAATVVGSYFCFVKGNWKEGVRLLRLSDNDLLSAAAIESNEETTDPVEMVRQGDAWWRVGTKATDPLASEAAKGRALYWYRLAIPNLGQTLDRLRANSRVQESPYTNASSVREKLKLISLKHDNRSQTSVASRGRRNDDDD